MFNFFRKKQDKSRPEDARATVIKDILTQLQRGEGVPLEAALALLLVEKGQESLTRFLIQFGASDLWLLFNSGEPKGDPAIVEGGDANPYVAAFSSKARAEAEGGLSNRVEAVSALELVFTLNATTGIVLNPNDPNLQWAFPPEKVDHLRTLFEQTFRYEPGAIHTICSKGNFRAAKVLAVDDGGIHIRVYANRWTERPTAIDPAELTLSSTEVDGPRAVGHMPLVRRSFLAMGPRSVANLQVEDSELEGYKVWEEAKGGYFGT